MVMSLPIPYRPLGYELPQLLRFADKKMEPQKGQLICSGLCTQKLVELGFFWGFRFDLFCFLGGTGICRVTGQPSTP